MTSTATGACQHRQEMQGHATVPRRLATDAEVEAEREPSHQNILRSARLAAAVILLADPQGDAVRCILALTRNLKPKSGMAPRSSFVSRSRCDFNGHSMAERDEHPTPLET